MKKILIAALTPLLLTVPTVVSIPSFAIPITKSDQMRSSVAQTSQGQMVSGIKSYTGIVKKVDDIAQQVTVRIDYQENGEAINGSGTIVGKEGDTYYLLTACHVVSIACKPENLIDNWVITMPDGEKLVVKSGKDAVTILNPDIDVAVIRFNSSKNHAVATIGNYTTKGKQWLFMTGFPGKDQSKQRLLTAGTVKAKDEAAFDTKDQYSMENGQELVYTNQSSGGMSGGGIFDAEGQLVGVNTASEDSGIIENGNYQEISLGYSLGVPITAFLGIAEAAKFSTQNFPKVANLAVEINANDIQQIKAQLFRFQVPQSGAKVADWVNYGNGLWRAGEYTEAVRAFDRAITLLGKNAKGENLANIYYAKGLALNDFGQILILTNNQKAVEKTVEALTAFQQATKTDPKFSNAWRWQGVILTELQRYPEALIAYDKAIAKGDKTDFVPYVEQGRVLNKLKLYPEALASYGQAINLKPNHPWAYNSRGLVYREQKHWDLALKDFNQAIKLNPQDYDYYSNRGLIYEDLDKHDLALNNYNKSIEINPQNYVAYHNRGLLYTTQKRWDLALKDINYALELNPNFPQAYFARAKYYEEMNKSSLVIGYREIALQDYDKAIELDPQFSLAYNNRGVIYGEQEKFDLAVKDFNKAIELDPQFSLAYNNRGNTYNQLKEIDLALKDYNQAIKLNPSYTDAYYNRANLYYSKGEWEPAVKDYEQVISLGLDPEHSFVFNIRCGMAYVNRGTFYYEKGEKKLALNDYNQAIKLNPQFADAYNNRGLLYYEKGEKELALNDYNQAIKLNPQFAKAYTGRGLLYYEKGERELALQDYNQAIKLNPQFAVAYYSRGVLYKEKGEKELALQDYNRAIKLDPQFAEAYYKRGVLYKEKGEKELALNDYNQAIKLNPQLAEAYADRGIMYLEMNNRQQAIQDLKIGAKLFYEQGNPIYQKILEVLKQLGQ